MAPVLAAGAAFALALAFALAPRAALAQTSTHTAAAEVLFRDGRALLKERRYAEACDKLVRSHELEPAVGTLLNIGECSAGQGKTASAWLAYRRAFALASERHDPRAAAADERSLAVEPQLSTVAVSFEGPPAPGTRVVLGGEPFTPAVLGEPIPVDPGSVTVAVSAPGRLPWSTELEVHARHEALVVHVPALERAPDPAELAHARDAAATRRAVALGVGAAGVLVAGAGAVLGMQAIVKIRDGNRGCPYGNACGDAAAVQESQSGRGLADASTVLIPVGAAVAGLGAVLFLTTHGPREGARVAADVSPQGARVHVGWSW